MCDKTHVIKSGPYRYGILNIFLAVFSLKEKKVL